jgi:hypothetical protein
MQVQMSVSLSFYINADLVRKMYVSEITQKEDAVDRQIDSLAIYMLRHGDPLLGNDCDINSYTPAITK